MTLENKKKFTNVCTYFLEAFSVGIFRSVGLYVRDWEYIYKYMVNSIQLRGGGGGRGLHFRAIDLDMAAGSRSN